MKKLFHLILQDWSERLETAKYRFVYFGYCLRHYTAFSVDKRLSQNGYFKAYAPIELSRLTMDKALTYLEDAMRIIESDLGMSFEGLKKPIYVEIFNKPKGTAGEFFAPYFLQGGGVLELNAKFFEKLPSQLTANEKNELRVTCGHELLHLVQEYYRDVGGISKEKIHWLDEATAVYAESLFAKQNGAPDLTSTYKELLGTVPLYYSHKKLNFANRQHFGYGASYLIFYLANNSAYKSQVVGAIYNKIKARSNPAAAFNSVFFMDTYWPKFWETAFTQPDKICSGLKYAVGNTIKLEQQNKTVADLKIKVPADLNKVVKNKTNTSLDFQVNLENLTALPIDFLMNPERAKNRDFINNPEAKVHLSLQGDTEGIQLLVLYRQGGNWKSKGFGKSGNTLNLVTQEEKKNFRLVFINNNDNLAELSTRQLRVQLEWSMGEQAQPNPNFEAQLKKLEQWRAFCAKQKQPQQQSNQFLRDYYSYKEKEYQMAIKLLKEEGEYIYESMGVDPKPEDPKDLLKDLHGALGLVLDASVASKKNREKMEAMARKSTGSERISYQNAAKFFQYRNTACQHLMRYIEAVRAAKVATSLSIKLSGRPKCEVLVNTVEKYEARSLNIQLNNIPYRLDGNTIYVDKGNLVFSSAYNYYSVNDKSAIRMQLSPVSGQIDFSYIESIPPMTRIKCENLYLSAKKR